MYIGISDHYLAVVRLLPVTFPVPYGSPGMSADVAGGSDWPFDRLRAGEA